MKKWIPVLTVAFAMLLVSDVAMAEEAMDYRAYRGLGAGLAMGFATLGGALAQGMAARGMYESVSRNPEAAGSLNAPFYVGMAFIESLVLFTFAIAFLLQQGG